MDAQAIFGLQFILSLIVIGLLTKWMWIPKLNQQDHNTTLFSLTIPHAFRHIGLVFLVPGVVDQPLPEDFSIPAAYGDLAAGILALLALIALRGNWSVAIAAVWLFNVVGTVDLLNALRHLDVGPLFGSTWYIPTMLVPLLLITHFLIFARLLKPQASPTS